MKNIILKKSLLKRLLLFNLFYLIFYKLIMIWSKSLKQIYKNLFNKPVKNIIYFVFFFVFMGSSTAMGQ